MVPMSGTVASMTAPEESIHPSISSIGIGFDNRTIGKLCLRTNVSSIKQVFAPELSGTKDRIGICWHKRLTPSKLYPRECELVNKLGLNI